VLMLKEACAASVELPDLKSAFYGATIEGGWPKPILLTLDPSPEVSRRTGPVRTGGRAADTDQI
jgi:hypothetical protein